MKRCVCVGLCIYIYSFQCSYIKYLGLVQSSILPSAVFSMLFSAEYAYFLYGCACKYVLHLPKFGVYFMQFWIYIELKKFPHTLFLNTAWKSELWDINAKLHEKGSELILKSFFFFNLLAETSLHNGYNIPQCNVLELTFPLEFGEWTNNSYYIFNFFDS